MTTPYERHFLLLCMASSVLIKIRAIFDDFFKDFHEKERIYQFSSPKVLRVIEIVKKFQPEKIDSDYEDFSENEKEEEMEETEEKTDSPNEELSKTPISSSCCRDTLPEMKQNCDINTSGEESNRCQCDLIHKFLLRRLESSCFSNISLQEALVLLVDNSKDLSTSSSVVTNNTNSLVKNYVESEESGGSYKCKKYFIFCRITE